MTAKQLNRLKQQADRYYQQLRQNLLQQLQPGNPRGFSHGIPREGNHFNGQWNSAPQQGMQFQFGRTPSEAQLQAYNQQNNPYLARYNRAAQKMRSQPIRESQRAAGVDVPASGPSITPQQQKFEAFFAKAEGEMDEANRQNEARYAEGKDELSYLRQRSQGRVGNWGHATAAINEERAQDALQNQLASLSAKGLGNSTIASAFQARANRDLALTQQALSEQRDQRMENADVRDTSALTGWIERRNDTGPDYNALIQMAMQAGQAGMTGEQDPRIKALEQQLARNNKNLYQGQQQLPVRPGPVGGVRPIFLGGVGMPMFGGGAPQMQQQEQQPQQPNLMGMFNAAGNRMDVENERAARVMKRRQAGYRKGGAQQAQRNFLLNQKLVSSYPSGNPNYQF